jgi:hypothetical protein
MIPRVTGLLLLGGSVGFGVLVGRWWAPLVPFLLGWLASYPGYARGDTHASNPFLLGTYGAVLVLVGVVLRKVSAAPSPPSHSDDVNGDRAEPRGLLWAWSLLGCPLVAFFAVNRAGSDGGAPKFVFLFLVLPALLSAGASWFLGTKLPQAVVAAMAAAAISGLIWFLLALAIASTVR